MHSLTVGDPEKKKIIFLHGWGGDASAFLFCAERLKGEFCSVLADFPGFGESPEPASAYSVADYAAEVLALADEKGIGSFIVAGHSFGGRVALELAAHSPARVRAMVLVDAAGLKPRRTFVRRLRIAVHKVLRRFGRKGLRGSADYRALSPAMKATFVRVVNYDQTPLLGDVRCPTAIFWGKDDRDTPLYMAKRFSRGIADSALFLLEGGHFAYLTDPTFFPVLAAFLRRV